MGNVCEGTSVHNGRSTFDGLHQIGIYRIPQQSRHSTLCFDIPGVNRLAGIIVGNQDITQTLFQVIHVLGKTENCHNLGSHGDNKAVFPRHAVDLATQTNDNIPQSPVIHIQATLDLNPPGVNAQCISLLEVVVQHGAAQVIGRSDRVHIPGEMKVDILHGQHLGISSSCSASLDTKHRSQRGFPQRNDSLLANFSHGLSQTGCGGGFTLTSRGGIDGGHQHQLTVGFLGQTCKGTLINLRLIPAVKLQLLLLDAKLVGDIRDRS